MGNIFAIVLFSIFNPKFAFQFSILISMTEYITSDGPRGGWRGRAPPPKNNTEVC